MSDHDEMMKAVRTALEILESPALVGQSSLAQAPGSEWDKHVRLVASMATDTLLGKGPSTRGFIANLRLIADSMEKLLPNAKAQTPPP